MAAGWPSLVSLLASKGAGVVLLITFDDVYPCCYCLSEPCALLVFLFVSLTVGKKARVREKGAGHN